MKPRSAAFSVCLLTVGLVVLIGVWASMSNNDLDLALCEANSAVSNTPSDCTGGGELPWIIVGGVLTVLGLLGFVMRSGVRTAIDEGPAATSAPGMIADLQQAAELHRSGALSDDEFSAMKRKLLG